MNNSEHDDSRIHHDVIDAVREFVEQSAACVSVYGLIGKRTSFDPIQSIVQRFQESIFKAGIDFPVPRSYLAQIRERSPAKPNRKATYQSSD
jgi:hypothetical protein